MLRVSRGSVVRRVRASQPLSSTVSSVFRGKTLDWGKAPESAAIAQAWLESHDRKFGMFVNGEWIAPGDRAMEVSRAPATGEVLAESAQATPDDVDVAVAAASTAFESWSTLAPHARARHLYSIARHIQKHSRLLGVIESLDNGKSVRETRDADIPLAVRHFYSHAGWAQLMESDPELSRCAPLGVVGQIIPWNFPLLMLSWKIAPALAMGNTVVIKPAPWTRLSAWAFAEICAEAGLPPGVVNVVSGDNEMAEHMATHDGFKKLAFTGSTGVGKALSRMNAGTGRKMSLELGGKSPVIVYDSADLDAAVEGLVNGIWYNQGQVCCAGSRLLVQESIAERFFAKVKRRMGSLRTGSSLDKCVDMGAVVDPIQHARIDEYVKIGRAEGADVFQADCPPGDGFYPATFVTNVQSTSPLVQEEIFGPVLVAQTFRTPEEAVELANNSCFGLSAGVWTESLGLAAETATQVRAGVVWVNGHNKFDAAAGFGGYKESGYGREGGREGLFAYLQPKWKVGEAPLGEVPSVIHERAVAGEWGKSDPTLPAPPQPTAALGGGGGKEGSGEKGKGKQLPGVGLPPIDRTPKLYVAGKQKRPDHEHSLSVYARGSGAVIGQVADGTRKDVRDAVEAAHAAAPGWGKRAAHNRAQILYYIAENLSIRHGEFAARIDSMTDVGVEAATKEVDASIERLFHYAAYADKYGGAVQETPFYGLTVAINEPTGVIGMVCPNESPLLGLVSLVAPAVVRGNCVIAVPSERHPLAATDLYQVLDTSDLPGGVINLITGHAPTLATTLAEHQDVDAMWWHVEDDPSSSVASERVAGREGSYHVERLAADNMKRTFVSHGRSRDWYSTEQGAGIEFLHESTEVKNIWMPMGE